MFNLSRYIFNLLCETLRGRSARMGKGEESVMPMFFFLWAIPAVIVIGGGTYWFLHLH
jgi:hypothetical protein